MEGDVFKKRILVVKEVFLVPQINSRKHMILKKFMWWILMLL
jgi:hypothetical protein